MQVQGHPEILISRANSGVISGKPIGPIGPPRSSPRPRRWRAPTLMWGRIQMRMLQVISRRRSFAKMLGEEHARSSLREGWASNAGWWIHTNLFQSDLHRVCPHSISLRPTALTRDAAKYGAPTVIAYFHSHILETVAPAASTSYSKATHALLRRASFCEVVRKKSMPR